MDALIHLIYASTASRPLRRDELLDLLSKARTSNQQLGLTGMLLHEAGNFFQVLEGPEGTVRRLFEHISRDPRHHQVVKIIQEPIARRAFADWTMGFADLSRAELDSIEGLNDFFCRGHSFAQLGSGRAKKLMSAFRQGRWHSKLKQPVETLAA
jgi:hypothetical protein